ncbi:integrin alpha-9-like [Ylistrum balloti]|uniref:integrin alpha-9-like n=1 Tax=Ylistrum balloti TaxID=509963 RepID=UPI002905B976|nr:integrin alpha-9-like [Ylistrum balloti]
MIFHSILIMILSTVFILFVVKVTKTNSLNLDVGKAHIFSGPKDSFFGYSVAFVKNGENEKWILIGAPRANDSSYPGLSKPGGLYKCQKDLQPSCEMISNINIGMYDVSDNWMGGSLDVGQQFILVCGHRWTRSYDENFSMNGICVEMGRDFDESRTRKYLDDPDKQVDVNDKLIYRIGAMGMSCAYAPTGKSRLVEKAMGAPGIYESTGGVVKRTDYDQSTDVVHFSDLSQTEGQLYGYSLTFGKLYGGEAFNLIIGGPRDGMTGQVKILKDKTNNFDLIQQLPGEQVGSYFGSALATTPLKAGEPEYLLVGAPMYSAYNRNNWNINGEIGKVYIYRYDPDAGKMLLTQTFNGSQSDGARYGTAVSSLNDINGDTYYDIAIGAPYEDEGRGVVYVYNGYHGGFWPKETQKLRGRDINPSLRTFGAAISKPFLYNDDAFYDTLIGAFMSDKAVLMFSQPTINMQVTMMIGDTITNDIIMEDTEKFTVKLCFSYGGKGLPSEADVEFMVDVDTNAIGKHRRVVLESGGYNINGSKTVQGSLTQTCVLPPYTVIVQSHTDLFVPVVFSTTYNIRNDIVSRCKNNVCPTVNTFNGAQANPTIQGFNKELALQRPGCGEDNVCQVDINVNAKAKFTHPDTDLIVGEDAKFELDVQMENKGADWAYSPFAEIEVPEYIDFVMSEPADVACYTSSSKQLVCQIPEVLKANGGKYFNLKFEASKAPVKDFVIKVEGHTISTDTNPGNNQQIISVSVRSKVYEEFRGNSIPEIYVTKEETDVKLVTHKFDFENNGPSALTSETEFKARFPFLRIDNQDLFVLQQFIVTTQLDKVVNVSSSETTSVRCWVNRDNSRNYMAVTTEDGEGVVSHKFSIQDFFNFEVNAVKKDCQTDECDSFTCGMVPIPAGFAVSITMNFTLSPKTLDKVKASVNDELKEVKILSVMTIDYPDDISLIEQEAEANTQTAAIVVLPNKPVDESIAWWIIPVSVLGAIVLCVAIAWILRKFGFFKRMKMPEGDQVLMQPVTTNGNHDGDAPVDNEATNGTVNNDNEQFVEKVDETEKLMDPVDLTEENN